MADEPPAGLEKDILTLALMTVPAVPWVGALDDITLFKVLEVGVFLVPRADALSVTDGAVEVSMVPVGVLVAGVRPASAARGAQPAVARLGLHRGGFPGLPVVL